MKRWDNSEETEKENISCLGTFVFRKAKGVVPVLEWNNGGALSLSMCFGGRKQRNHGDGVVSFNAYSQIVILSFHSSGIQTSPAHNVI